MQKVSKIFLLGILLGALASVFSKLLSPGNETIVQGALEARIIALPINPVLLWTVILLNNLVVVLMSSIGPTVLILIILWGRKKVSLWQKINESKLGKLLDRTIWKFISFLRPKFSDIKKSIHKDIFIVSYGLPTFTMLINGGFLGFLFMKGFLIYQLSGLIVLLKWIAPHGVLEIPIILTSAALGFTIADNILDSLLGEETSKIREKTIAEVRNIGVFKILSILIFLIVIAAWIEAFLTPKIALGI